MWKHKGDMGDKGPRSSPGNIMKRAMKHLRLDLLLKQAESVVVQLRPIIHASRPRFHKRFILAPEQYGAADSKQMPQIRLARSALTELGV